MFRHVWYELTGNFISHLLELIKISFSFLSGVKAPVEINLRLCQALWMCAGIRNAQRKNVKCTEEEASKKATQI